MKISTNSQLAARKSHWIDFNAGVLLEGSSMDQVQEELLDYIIDLASGSRRTNNEKHEFREISIFKDGVIL